MKILHTFTLSLSCLLFAGTVLADNHGGEAPFRHAVFFKFKETATDNEIQRVVDEFLLLKGKIDTIKELEWGMSESVEGLNKEFTHCFFLTFENQAGLETYIPHPDHEAFVAIVKPLLEDVFVFDYTAKD